MANYLLLRNNKESGPFSLDELMELGLKPYDLIWIQGKSAAWRYPSEVEELKGIAPVIEEQPFDRFFKKAEEKKEAVPTPIQQEVNPTSIPEIKPEHEKYIPKKSVYVTMPGQKSVAVKEPITSSYREPVTEEVKSTYQEPVKEPIKSTYQEPVQQSINEAASVKPTITISENPAAAQIKYSQPLDEIKEMYVRTLQDRKQKIARKSFLVQNLKKAAALLSLVAVGLVLGLVLRSNGSREKQVAQQQTTLTPLKSEMTVVVPEANSTEAISNDSVASSDVPVQPLQQPNGGFVNKNPLKENIERPTAPNEVDHKISNNVAINGKNKLEEKTLLKSETLASSGFLPESVEIDRSTGERNRKVRSKNSETFNGNDQQFSGKITEKKPSIGNGLSRLVTVKSNEYKRVAFGGIRDLHLTVTNDSKYVLDNVIVELQYIKPNELPLKTESIEFTSIAPNATSTVRIPDTNRGIKVVYRITHIKSKQMEEGGVAGN